MSLLHKLNLELNLEPQPSDVAGLLMVQLAGANGAISQLSSDGNFYSFAICTGIGLISLGISIGYTLAPSTFYSK